MPDATITSTASTFGTISGTFAADQSTIVGTVTGIVAGTLDGSVGVPGPAGEQGPVGPEGPPGPPGVGGTWGSILGDITTQVDLWGQLQSKAPIASPVFTGDARAVTPAFGDNDTSIATTAFVQSALAGGTAVAKNLEVEVRNQSGSTIPAGSIVYISGATGNKPLITLAQANNDTNSAQTIGFVKTSIANNGTGFVIVRGELENIDTSALTEGVQLYLSPTTAGTWTTTKPSAPQHLVYVGIVIRSHPTQGTILVAVQNGYELDELHDVAIASKANNDLLAYESSTDLWKNKTYSALGLLTSSAAASTYYPLSGNPSGFLTSSALTGYATESWVTSGFYPLTGNPSGFIDASYLSGYAALTGADFTGRVTIASVAGGPPNFNIGNVSGVTGMVDGDIWKDIAGLHYYDGSDKVLATETFVTAQGYLTDAPSDGNQYARKDGAWDIVSGGGGYITSVTSPLSVTSGDLSIDLSAYATESWVASFGFASESWVGSNFAQIESPTFTGAVTIPAGASISGYATTDSPALSGTPTSTTAAADTNSTRIATTAFVVGQASSTTPANNGTAAVGTSLRYARADHVHASDTTRAALSGATFTGKVNTVASTTGTAGLSLPHGTAPSSPTNGDLWSTTAGVFARVNGVTQTLGGGGGGGTDYQVYTTPGTATWTKPANAKWVEIVMFGGGGGGGSGARQATTSARSGGGGGAPGAFVIARINASSLGATETVTVGAGGTGGAGAGGDNFPGNNGTNGTASQFSYYRAAPGAWGNAGSTTVAAGGVGVAGFRQGVAAQTSPNGGGGALSAGGAAPNLATNLTFAATGGGGGAGAGASSTTNNNGGSGGNKSGVGISLSGLINTVLGGSGGTTAGVAAVVGVSGLTVGAQGGTGGGGGAYRTGVAGMAGAAGGLFGGGGGGGSASDNGFLSGAGGNGGAGGVIVITYS